MSDASPAVGREFKHWLFKGYVRAFRPRRKPRRRRPTDRGQLILTGAVLTAALGLNTESSYVYQLFSLLLCLAIAARLGLRFSKPDVSVQRLLPRYATAGQNFTYRIRVTNLGAKTEADLTISDFPAAKLPSLDQYRAEKEPFEDSRNAYDRFIGFHRFIYLQKQLTGITTLPAQIDEIPVKGYQEAEINATPLRRGKVNFSHTVVLHQDPLGLSYGYNHFKNAETLLVLPERFRLNPNWQIASGRNFQPGGVTSAWSVGESDEFVSLRDYRDGDSMRKIHWASSAKQAARKQNLVVKEYQDEFFARNALIIDINHAETSVVEKTISVAASFAMDLQQTDAMLDLIYLTQDGPRMITAGRGTSAVNEQLEALATMQPEKADFQALADRSLLHARLVTGCICVFASWQNHHAELVRRLRSQGTELRCLVLTEDQERRGPYTPIRPSRAQEDLTAA